MLLTGTRVFRNGRSGQIMTVETVGFGVTRENTVARSHFLGSLFVDVVLDSQVSIDKWTPLLSSVKYLTGSLTVQNSDITSAHLNFLVGQLQWITGDVNIVGNNNLADIEGFRSLRKISGNLWIYSNTNLFNVEGLRSLTTIDGDLQISNTSLASVEGLRSLTNVGGYLYIDANNNLASVEGLRSLTNIGGYLVMDNNKNLASVEGLRSLKFIRGSSEGKAIYLYNNPILAHGLPFPALTCKSGAVCDAACGSMFGHSNNAYVNANIPALSSLPSC